ncbi:mRNA binding protein puf3, partial [Clydaea vesicula]
QDYLWKQLQQKATGGIPSRMYNNNAGDLAGIPGSPSRTPLTPIQISSPTSQRDPVPDHYDLRFNQKNLLPTNNQNISNTAEFNNQQELNMNSGIHPSLQFAAAASGITDKKLRQILAQQHQIWIREQAFKRDFLDKTGPPSLTQNIAHIQSDGIKNHNNQPVKQPIQLNVNNQRDQQMNQENAKGSVSPNRNKSVNNNNSSKESASNAEGYTRSPLLEEFRCNKNKKYEVIDIVGSIVEFSGDQHGSRFIQQKLEVLTEEEMQLVFDEILPHSLQLMTDVFGNYVIQKLFVQGNHEQKRLLANQMQGHVLPLSLQMYGCRVVQKGLEYSSEQQQASLIKELEGHVLKCVKDQNGNHVIQRAIESIPPQHVQFIIDAFHGQVYSLATHPYGCRVIQRIFEYCDEEHSKFLLDELHRFTLNLIQDQYGNYVIQHVLEKGRPADKAMIVVKVRGQVLQMSRHKFASNVVEKCIAYGSKKDRQVLIEEVIQVKPDGTCPLVAMMKDQFANYVIQKMLDVADGEQRETLVCRIRPNLPCLKKFAYGKHLISKIEKMLLMGIGLNGQNPPVSILTPTASPVGSPEPL